MGLVLKSILSTGPLLQANAVMAKGRVKSKVIWVFLLFLTLCSGRSVFIKKGSMNNGQRKLKAKVVR